MIKEKVIVSNSSPIINLGKQGMLHILKNCFNKILLPKSVFKEITEKENSIEAKHLEKAINEKWIIVKKVSINKAINTEKLGQGEKEAISLAKNKNSFLLIDDNNAKKYASILNVECHGTLYVIYVAVLKKFITKREAKKILENMIKENFYISTEIYAGFLELLDKF